MNNQDLKKMYLLTNKQSWFMKCSNQTNYIVEIIFWKKIFIILEKTFYFVLLGKKKA